MLRLGLRLCLLVMVVATTVVYPQVGRAQATGAVINDQLTDWTVADGLLYWAEACAGGEFVGPGYLRRKPVNGGTQRTLSTTTSANCANFKNMVADSTGLYYFSGSAGGIYFRPANAPFDPPIKIHDTTPAEAPANGTNLVLVGDTIYWIAYGRIMRVKRDGTGYQEFVNGFTDGRDLLIIGTAAYWLDDNGLWRASTNCSPLPCTTKTRQVVTNGYYLMYVQTGTRANASDNFFWSDQSSPQRILRYTCGVVAFCSTSTFYTAPNSNTSLGEPVTDGTSVFWTERFSAAGEQSDGRLRRKPLAGGEAVEIVTNIPTVADQLEVDNLYVYYHWYGVSPPSGIYRIALNAAAIVRDLAADALEVTQGIQNLANQAPLVAKKTTYIRGYGRAVSGSPARSVDGWLYGERGGVALPGSPLRPVNGVLGLTVGVANDRSNVNQSWLFQVPPSWTAAGNISLRLVVDPRAAYSDTARTNNELTGIATFTTKGPVCPIFVPVRTNAPAASTNSANFWPMIDVAKRLWPTPDYWVYKSSVGIEELELCTWGPFPYPCGGPFELPSDTWKVFLGIGTIDVFTDDPDACQDAGGSIHYVGMVHPSTNTREGSGTVLGTGMTSVFNYSWVKFPDTTPIPPNASVLPDAGVTLAHELAHNLGRKHVNCGGPANPDGSYPYPTNQIGDVGAANYYGFDPRTRKVIAPTAAKDFMSYCDPVWTSDYTWRAIFNKLDSFNSNAQSLVASGTRAAPLAAAANVVLVTGAVTPTANSGELGYAYNFPTASLGAGLLRKWQARAGGGQGSAQGTAPLATTYHVRLLDSAGAVLLDQPVTPLEPELEGEPSPVLYFIATFPAPTGTVAKLELLQDNTVIATRTPGAATPTVQIAKPAGGETIGDTIELNWSANDTNSDDILHYAVQYSPDGGTTWRAIFSDIIGPREPKTVNITINALQLPASTPNGGRLRVAASDGYNTGIAVSQPFTVSNRKPEPFIIDPAPDTTTEAGQAVGLRGDAMDVEDGGLSEAALRWSINNQPVGTGEELNVGSGLAPGSYNVTLTAQDALAQTGSATATLRIAPLNIPLASAPSVDGFCDDTGYAASTQLPLAAYSDGSNASVRLVRSTNALWACFSGLRTGTTTPGAAAGLRLDRNYSRDAVAQTDDYSFLVGEDGGIATLQGNGAGAFVQAGTSGLSAQVSSNGTLWNAELRVDAAVLNGFEHYIGLEVGHYDVGSAGDNYRWPHASVANQPNTWAQTALGTAPSLTELSPAVATAGSANVTVTISGTNFISATLAQLNGATLPTTVLSATLLQATVGADKLAAAGTAPISALNPGNLASNPLSFQVQNPQPTINALAPNTAVAEGPAFTLTVNGSGFRNGSQVYWNGDPLPTTFNNQGQLTAQVAAGRIFQGQTANVTVVNPDPAIGAADPASFVVTPKQAQPGSRLYLPVVVR